MSIKDIRIGLEKRLNALTPALATVLENAAYTPVPGTPFQVVNLLPAPTQNNTFGSTTTIATETGILQVMLHYPPNTGSKAVYDRAELIRDWFPRGLSITQNGVKIVINRTPAVGPSQPSNDWYRVPVSIPYFAHVVR